jgi:hypothetical protein
MMRLIWILHMGRKTGYVGIAGKIQPAETIKIIIGSRLMMLPSDIQSNFKRTTRKKR